MELPMNENRKVLAFAGVRIPTGETRNKRQKEACISVDLEDFLHIRCLGHPAGSLSLLFGIEMEVLKVRRSFDNGRER
jgi:hypothetical protein